MDKNKKVLIDCDPGTDDAHAIAMAVTHDNIDLVAITTVFGNVDIDQTTVNALWVLNEWKKSDVPVFKGCNASLIGKGSPNTGYHGKHGLGDVTSKDTHAELLVQTQQEHAVNAIIRLAKQYSGELSIVAMGPLTNLAIALQLEPSLKDHIAQLVIMGGNTKAKGNITATAEFNFHCDPEAAIFVLNNYGGSITLFDLELCQQYSPSWEFYDRLVGLGKKKSAVFAALFQPLWTKLKHLEIPRFLSYDQSALGCIINPSIVVEGTDVYVTVELAGSCTRGQMVVDWNGKLGQKPNVHLVTKLDLELLESMMIAAAKD